MAEKITTDFDIYKHEADDKEEEYEIIAFENDAFQYGEAVFLAQVWIFLFRPLHSMQCKRCRADRRENRSHIKVQTRRKN